MLSWVYNNLYLLDSSWINMYFSKTCVIDHKFYVNIGANLVIPTQSRYFISQYYTYIKIYVIILYTPYI